MEKIGVPILQFQLSALYHASQSLGEAEQVFAVASVDEFEYGSQQKIAQIIIRLMRNGEVSPALVGSEAGKESIDLYKYFGVSISSEHWGTPTFCANRVHEEGIRAKLGTSILRAQANLHDTSRTSEEIAATLMQDVETLNASISSGMPTIRFDDMYSTPEDSRKWVVPGCLRQNERMILTGREGGGKSTLVAQLCLSAAMGINSLALGYPSHEPLKVLMLDVENDRLQIKQNMRKIYPTLFEMTGQVPNMMWADVRNIDLSNSVEQASFIRLCKTEQPDLVYAGSLYKLAPETAQVDGQFSAISRTVDLIRAETAASFILEAHAPHGMANDRAGMRPYGSSSWLRWPEFGFGMAQIPQDKSVVKMTTWRGARSDDRFWPAGLKRNGVLPWSPIMSDEWEVLYGE
tara:strand:- start:2381 stop:3595 length:1215 start_codon:yes stop_codon:yes gene_type:complete